MDVPWKVQPMLMQVAQDAPIAGVSHVCHPGTKRSGRGGGLGGGGGGESATGAGSSEQPIVPGLFSQYCSTVTPWLHDRHRAFHAMQQKPWADADDTKRASTPMTCIAVSGDLGILAATSIAQESAW